MAKLSSNAAEFTVSKISDAVRKTLESSFGNVRVRGEISGFRGIHASGHAYFALKDEKARLEAVIWRGSMQGLKFKPEEGLEVIAGGRLSSYPGSSKYQLIIDSLEPAGAGALMALLEERRKKLAAEGLFAQERKKALPFMPKIIGVITSPTGAVIRDIIHRISDRFPLHILVWPARVQGETAAAEITAAIHGFNALPAAKAAAESKLPAAGAMGETAIPRPDLLIIARGGGSLEDLWGFNDEALVRAAAQSAIPIISAIGHETDWTLLDYAADKRAPTPTGAAEMAVPVKADLEAALSAAAKRLYHASRRFLAQKRQDFSNIARAFPAADRLLADANRRFDDAAMRLTRALDQGCRQKRIIFEASARSLAPRLVLLPLRQKGKDCRNLAGRLKTAFSHNKARGADRLAMLARLLKNASLAHILERGFALVQDKNGALIRSKTALKAGQEIRLRFADGAAAATAGRADEAALPAAAASAVKPRGKKAAQKDNPESKPAKTPKQGDLF